ncbi:SpoIIE family protein phosphatase [Streptomyces gossypiisoli]|uniref:SpoIIE family protein phosphatase n=1 Tax=Streptomyces gossypiisoli TaxID=2748864 RepID=UPI002F964EDA
MTDDAHCVRRGCALAGTTETPTRPGARRRGRERGHHRRRLSVRDLRPGHRPLHCALGRSRHASPALVHPGEVVTFPTVPVFPPLGLASGVPNETADLHVLAGSRLALHADGLVENRERALDTGLEHHSRSAGR